MIYTPDPGQPTRTTVTVDGGPPLLDQITDWANSIPGTVWAAAAALLLAAAILTLPLARRRMWAAGRRAAGHTPADRRDRTLLAAALTPAALFWLAVLAGSARGLIAFGRDTLRWTGGWEYLVPLTLDGIAVSFGVLAFRALHNRRNPDRSMRIAWAAMLASAGINYAHEAHLPAGSWLGGLYLALMSLFGMLIFHEFLAQFEDGTEWIKRANPKFGLRWLTWPTNTACAWVAWRNHPPTEGTRATIPAAVAHLETVRAGKRAHRGAALLAGPARPWWAPIAPWAHAARLAAAVAEQRRSADTERAAWSTRLEQVASDHEKAVQRAEHLAEQLSAALSEREAERSAARAAEHQIERLRQQAAEQAERYAALAAQRAEQTTRTEAPRPSAPAKTGANTTKTAPKLTDEQAVALMLAEHPKPGYEWGSREVHRLTGAGFGRIPKLIAAVAEHHARSAAPEQSAESGDDDAEHAGAAVSA